MRITKADVIQTASHIADTSGLSGLSLKAVAEQLHIKTPSLYNHIASLDDLLRAVAHKGMRTMTEAMTQAAIGVSGDAAMKAVSIAYMNFMILHPGVYETIQWATWHGTEETTEIWGNYTGLITRLVLSCQLNPEKAPEICSLFVGVLHGYTTLQLRYALMDPVSARESLSNAIDTVLLGIHAKYDL